MYSSLATVTAPFIKIKPKQIVNHMTAGMLTSPLSALIIFRGLNGGKISVVSLPHFVNQSMKPMIRFCNLLLLLLFYSHQYGVFLCIFLFFPWYFKIYCIVSSLGRHLEKDGHSNYHMNYRTFAPEHDFRNCTL